MVGRPPKFTMKKTTLIFLFAVSVSLLSPVTAVRGATISSLDAASTQVQNFQGFAQSAKIPVQESGVFGPQDCKHSSSLNQSESLCQSVLSDGSMMTLENHAEKAWNEFKEQAILTIQNSEKQIMHQRVIRHKIQFTSSKQTKRVKESFDIVRYPKDDKTTREFVVLEYRPDGKDVRRVYYSKYSQIGDTAEASLIYHTVLTYDEKGMPLKGRAESWKDAQKSKELFRWDRRLQGTEGFDAELWQQWESMAARAAQLQTLLA